MEYKGGHNDVMRHVMNEIFHPMKQSPAISQSSVLSAKKKNLSFVIYNMQIGKEKTVFRFKTTTIT